MDTTQIGPYQIGKCLGEGATATVHVGVPQDGGDQVALKVLHPELVDNDEMLARFRREARTLRSLTHRNIVGFIGFIEEPPNYVFVMELLEGGTLETYLAAKGTVRADRVLAWTHQLSQALAEAHSRGVVHRDIKPANVFLTTKGRVVLSDFGLARPEHDKVTRAGAKMVGTPLYMAPEQILGRTATPATDIYQVGLLLYEMILGERPFPRGDSYSQMMARLDEDLFVPMEADVPPLMREIVRRCGFCNPERRYPDGKALESDLAGTLEGEKLRWVPPAPGAQRKGTLTTQGLDWKDPGHYQGTLLVCPQVNLRYDPQQKPFVIGSDPAVQVCLQSRGQPIAPRQIRILPTADGWQVETGNFQAEVLVNGAPLHAGSRPLATGDVLALGGYELLWVDHAEPPPTSVGPRPVQAADLGDGPEVPARGCATALLLAASSLAGVAAALTGAG